ncbi:hypothetical protein Tco_0934469 [Tanacetum coccineum]
MHQASRYSPASCEANQDGGVLTDQIIDPIAECIGIFCLELFLMSEVLKHLVTSQFKLFLIGIASTFEFSILNLFTDFLKVDIHIGLSSEMLSIEEGGEKGFFLEKPLDTQRFLALGGSNLETVSSLSFFTWIAFPSLSPIKTISLSLWDGVLCIFKSVRVELHEMGLIAHFEVLHFLDHPLYVMSDSVYQIGFVFSFEIRFQDRFSPLP